MYNRYFGFRESPFSVTPDPGFFYANPLHLEALATLHYGITGKKGLIVITGEVGTGKTTLLRKLTRNLESTIHSVFIFNTRIDFTELLQLTLRSLGLTRKDNDALAMIEQLNDYLIEQLKKGQIVALLVDEAQNLADDVFEGLRLLSNLETEKEKLLQIVLVGQPELKAKLDQPGLRHLKQRVALQCQLVSLKSGEVGQYIDSRLREAGYEGEDLFSPDAIELIGSYSRGIPRLINVICDNALTNTFGTSQKKITIEMIDEVAYDLRLTSSDFASLDMPATEAPLDFAAKDIAVAETPAEVGDLIVPAESAATEVPDLIVPAEEIPPEFAAMDVPTEVPTDVAAVITPPAEARARFDDVNVEVVEVPIEVASTNLAPNGTPIEFAAMTMPVAEARTEIVAMDAPTPEASVKVAAIDVPAKEVPATEPKQQAPRKVLLHRLWSEPRPIPPWLGRMAALLLFAVATAFSQDGNLNLKSLLRSIFEHPKEEARFETSSSPSIEGVNTAKIAANTPGGNEQSREGDVGVDRKATTDTLVSHPKQGSVTLAQQSQSEPPQTQSRKSEPLLGTFDVVSPSLVRATPSSDSEIITTLQPRTQVKVLSAAGSYFRVQSMEGEKIRGYVHREDAFFVRSENRDPQPVSRASGRRERTPVIYLPAPVLYRAARDTTLVTRKDGTRHTIFKGTKVHVAGFTRDDNAFVVSRLGNPEGFIPKANLEEVRLERRDTTRAQTEASTTPFRLEKESWGS